MKPISNDIDSLRKLLRDNGMKVTSTRLDILVEIFGQKDHIHSDELLNRLKEKGKKVSRATVYRTLDFLIKKGLMRRLQWEQSKTHYDQNYTIAEHDHLICLNCGNVIEFRDDTLRNRESELCERFNFTPAKYSVQIFGYCKSPDRCASEGGLKRDESDEVITIT